MRTVIIFMSILLMAWSSKANGCDEVAIVGGFGILTSTIVFPLMGLNNDDRENPPYWRAVSYTFAASLAGGALALTRCKNFSNENGDEVIVSIIVFGAVATYLTYRYAPRKSDKSSSALWRPIPQVSVSPVDGGGSIRLNWSF